MSVEPTTDQAEVARLRARVEELESQLVEQQQRSAAIVARSQEKLYWLERWHIDLDAVMSKPGAIPALDGLKRFRGVARSSKKLKRRLLGQ